MNNNPDPVLDYVIFDSFPASIRKALRESPTNIVAESVRQILLLRGEVATLAIITEHNRQTMEQQAKLLRQTK